MGSPTEIDKSQDRRLVRRRSRRRREAERPELEQEKSSRLTRLREKRKSQMAPDTYEKPKPKRAKLIVDLPEYEDEKSRNIAACNIFLRLGPYRSMPMLRKELQKKWGIDRTPNEVTLNRWRKHWHWDERATQFDHDQDLLESYRFWQATTTGLARADERINRLKVLADTLYEAMFDESGDLSKDIWLDDVKTAGGVPVALRRFNGPMLSEFRNTLADIAKELGQRNERLTLAGDEEKPISHEHTIVSELTNEDLATVAAIASRYKGRKGKDSP